MLGKEIWAKNVGVAGLRRGFSTKYIESDWRPSLNH